MKLKKIQVEVNIKSKIEPCPHGHMGRHVDTKFSFSKLNQFHNFQYSLLRLPLSNFLRQVTNFIQSLTLELGVIFNIVCMFKFSVLAYPGYHLVIKSVNLKAADFLKWR